MDKKQATQKIKKKLKVQSGIVKDETEELKEQLARALADYANLSKRVEKEKEEFGQIANLKLIVSLLPLIDMFDQAQDHLNDSGLAIAIDGLKNLLKDENIEEIKINKGDLFDEETCEAVMVIDLPEDKVNSKIKERMISEVILTGWRFSEGPVIRPAKVKVYKHE